MYPSINREALVVRARQPFYDWFDRVDPNPGPPMTPDEDSEPSVYLVCSKEETATVDEAIKKHWKMIFEAELDGWCPDQTFWPKKLNKRLFVEWFDISWSSFLQDTCTEALFHDL